MTAMIEASGLTKRYGKTVALDGLDLTADDSQVVAVLGPNGAGKTTFVRTVATLLRADAGTLMVAGYDARKQPATVRRVIGLAGQFAAIEPAMTGRENLEMVARLFGQSRRTAKASAAGVLEQLGLAGDGDRLARTSSGGMRRIISATNSASPPSPTAPSVSITSAARTSPGCSASTWSSRWPPHEWPATTALSHSRAVSTATTSATCVATS